MFLRKPDVKIMCNREGSCFSILNFSLHRISFEKHFCVNEVSGTRFRTQERYFICRTSSLALSIWKFAAAFPDERGWGKSKQCGNLKKS